MMDHSIQFARPAWDAASHVLAFTGRGGGEVARFRVSAEAGGKALVPASWEMTPEGGAVGLAGGFEIRIGFRPVAGAAPALAAIASITNRTGATAALGALRFAADGLVVADCGTDLRIYKEGWSMTTPAVSVRHGDKDSFLNPDYKCFACPSPAAHDDATPNRFAAQYAVVLNNPQRGDNLLVGFISSESQVARFTLGMDAGGLTALEAICDGDGIELAPGECVASEEWVVLTGTDGYALLETFAGLWAKRMQAITWSHTPTGWCSWTYYFERVTAADMLENVAWLRDHGRDFPIEYIQMDDGYQSALGDWLTCEPVKFPNGLEPLAQEIKAAGFKPGIWLAPFLVDERSALYAAHPDWTVKDPLGATVWVIPDWRGARVAVLDCTRPEVCAWLTDLFATLARWGYEYVKLDFLVHEAGAWALGGRYADPKATRVGAIRRGLQAIRAGFGDDKLIMGCTNVLGAGVGIVNACRIATDFLPAWNHSNEPFKEAPTLPNVLRNIINRRYMHGRLWINDPDAHLARIDNCMLTEDEVRMFTAAVWLAGGTVFSGDRFSTLSAERGQLFRMLLDDLEAFEQVRPLDLFAGEYPELWLGISRKDPNLLVIGAFNFDDQPKVQQVDLTKAGIPPASPVGLREFWSQQPLGEVTGSFRAVLKPHSCQIFLLTGGVA